MDPLYEVSHAVVELLARGGRAALATVVRVGGSTPQRLGARLLRYPDGTILGTVGGGQFEHMVIAALDRCLEDGTARTLAWDLARDLGMCCGGRMEVLVESLSAAPRLILFGAGHVGCPTAQMASKVGFHVTVVDEREELNSDVRFEGCTRLHATPDEALRQLRPTASDWFLIMTHDHQLDERALGETLRGPHRYIGMIGSRRKVLRLVERVRARHGTLDLSRLFAPVGLAIGAEGPEEIAVSVVAELVALRRGQHAPHLRTTAMEPAAEKE